MTTNGWRTLFIVLACSARLLAADRDHERSTGRMGATEYFEGSEVNEYSVIVSRTKIPLDGWDPPGKGSETREKAYETARILLTPFLEAGRLKLRYKTIISSKERFGHHQGRHFGLQQTENSLARKPADAFHMLEPAAPEKKYYLETIVDLGPVEGKNGVFRGKLYMNYNDKADIPAFRRDPEEIKEEEARMKAAEAKMKAEGRTSEIPDTSKIPDPPADDKTPEPKKLPPDKAAKQLVDWSVTLKDGHLETASVKLVENSFKDNVKAEEILREVWRDGKKVGTPFPAATP